MRWEGARNRTRTAHWHHGRTSRYLVHLVLLCLRRTARTRRHWIRSRRGRLTLTGRISATRSKLRLWRRWRSWTMYKGSVAIARGATLPRWARDRLRAWHRAVRLRWMPLLLCRLLSLLGGRRALRNRWPRCFKCRGVHVGEVKFGHEVTASSIRYLENEISEHVRIKRIDGKI